MGPTPEQDKKITEIKAQGYTWDQDMSLSAAGVVFRKGEDIWFFGLDGEVMHNPDGLHIKL